MVVLVARRPEISRLKTTWEAGQKNEKAFFRLRRRGEKCGLSGGGGAVSPCNAGIVWEDVFGTPFAAETGLIGPRHPWISDLAYPTSKWTLAPTAFSSCEPEIGCGDLADRANDAAFLPGSF
jgi:hypothetical protein